MKACFGQKQWYIGLCSVGIHLYRRTLQFVHLYGRDDLYIVVLPIYITLYIIMKNDISKK